ncbi:type 1 fimbria pilin [Klebsiella sp. BIGb0407]|nr:fimbrial protein [Klebsiella sp. BIGb0407]MCS3430279.1 type 1 fimbria pilin [Klebsiella sp. BIGb0407]
MMKIRLTLLALFLFSTSQSTMADINVPTLPQHKDQTHQSEDSGNVIFHGSVYASPCVLAPESRLQTVDLGEMSAGTFHQSGDRSLPAQVRVEFRDCLKGASQARDSGSAKTIGDNKHSYTNNAEQAVQMTMVGDSDENNSQLLHLTGTTSGAGIRLLDTNQRAMDINQTQSPFLVKSGDSSQIFHAALESTGQTVTAGHFNGLLRLKMEYQ